MKYLKKIDWNKKNIVKHLMFRGEQALEFRESALKLKQELFGKGVYLRALIEYSNYCYKDCYYCGIRHSNSNVERYDLPVDVVLDACQKSIDQGYRFFVIQSGEIKTRKFINDISFILKRIKTKFSKDVKITLSCGEQCFETYKLWKESGADRYLLRFESSNPELFRKIHPADLNHDFRQRMRCLEFLKDIGYQVGSGMMVGIPSQTVEDLADDLLLLKKLNVYMVGLGPYVEHKDTPIFGANGVLSKAERLELTLNVLAVFAASTALYGISDTGRFKGICSGPNVVMFNQTPAKYQEMYSLYNRKDCLENNVSENRHALEKNVKRINENFVYCTEEVV